MFILLNFFIISLNYPFPTYARSLSLSLKNYQPRSLLHRVLSSPADPDPFFTGRSMNQVPRPKSFLHWPIHKPSSGDPNPFFTGRSTNQASATHILSSPADPRTKLHDPDHFFTGRSTNQTPQAPIYLSVGLSVCVCLCVGVFLCRFVCVDVFVCIWGKECEKLRSLCMEKREKNWCKRKLIK